MDTAEIRVTVCGSAICVLTHLCDTIGYLLVLDEALL